MISAIIVSVAGIGFAASNPNVPTTTLTTTLMSGLIGSILTVLLTFLYAEYKRHREYMSLLDGVIAECDYNLSIVDEILDGVTNHKGSFKRLSVDYFRYVREKSVDYSYKNALISALSRIIVDMELFNLEADYVFNGKVSTQVYAGMLEESTICITRKPVSLDITATITKAHEGVVASLNGLKKIAFEIKNGKDCFDE